VQGSHYTANHPCNITLRIPLHMLLRGMYALVSRLARWTEVSMHRMHGSTILAHKSQAKVHQLLRLLDPPARVFNLTYAPLPSSSMSYYSFPGVCHLAYFIPGAGGKDTSN
jgi:hypothetical protein